MTVPVVSAGNDVNRAMGLIDRAMLNEIRVEPSSYINITYGYGEGASENWPRVAANLDFAHLVHGHPTTYPKRTIFDWVRRKATAKNLLENEGSLLSPVYYEDHTFRPMVGVWGLLQVLGARGDMEAVELARLLKTWLRACVLNAAKCSLMVTPKGLSDIQAHDSTTFKPGVLVARSAPYPWSPVVAVAACGDRGWDIDDGKWPWYVVQTAAGFSVAEFGLGLNSTGGTKCKQAEILRSKFGLDTSLFSSEERSNIRLLIQGNKELLTWALSEINDFAPDDRCREIATTGGMTTVNLNSRKGATSCRFCHTILSDGTVYAAGTDSPHRGGSAERNREHFATVDMDRRMAIGTAEATAYDPASRVECPVAPGDVLWDFEWGGGEAPVVYVGGDLFGGLKPPAPPEDPEWLHVKMTFNQQGGRYCGRPYPYPVLPVDGHSNFWLLLKGDPPFAIEGWTIRDGYLMLLFEEILNGQLGPSKWRTFWNSEDGKPGVPWFSEQVRSDGTISSTPEHKVYQMLFNWEVEPGVHKDGPADSYMQFDCFADFDSRFRSIVRVDGWGDPDGASGPLPPNVTETYHLSYEAATGRPAGLTAWMWDNRDPDVEDPSWVSTSMGTISMAPHTFYAPLTPQGTVEWVGVLGVDFVKPQPQPAPKHPALGTPPKPDKPSWIERLGL